VPSEASESEASETAEEAAQRKSTAKVPAKAEVAVKMRRR